VATQSVANHVPVEAEEMAVVWQGGRQMVVEEVVDRG
jgi:hypothetical protein